MPVITYSRERQLRELVEYHVSGMEIAALCDVRPGDKVEVVFAVPGGGDYSNMELDISPERPVIVRVSRTTIERE